MDGTRLPNSVAKLVANTRYSEVKSLANLEEIACFVSNTLRKAQAAASK